MYQIGLSRTFRARHFLVGGDWGPENSLHDHDYRVEWILEGPELDQHGFLLDLVAVEGHLKNAIGEVRERTLNELAAFEGLNPSLEHLTRHLSGRLTDTRNQWDPDYRLKFSTVKVFEKPDAWASWVSALPAFGAPL